MVRVNVEVFGLLRQCLVTLYRGQGHLGLESWCVISSRPSQALAPLFAVTSTAWVEQGYHVSDCPNVRDHLCRRARYEMRVSWANPSPVWCRWVGQECAGVSQRDGVMRNKTPFFERFQSFHRPLGLGGRPPVRVDPLREQTHGRVHPGIGCAPTCRVFSVPRLHVQGHPHVDPSTTACDHVDPPAPSLRQAWPPPRP